MHTDSSGRGKSDDADVLNDVITKWHKASVVVSHLTYSGAKSCDMNSDLVAGMAEQWDDCGVGVGTMVDCGTYKLVVEWYYVVSGDAYCVLVVW